MSYHRTGLGAPPAPAFGPSPGFTPTTAFAQAVDPYSFRFSPPGAIFAPYGWGPDFMVGMPANYTHHIGYERVPVPGTRPIGPMYDQIWPYATGVKLSGMPAGPPGYLPVRTPRGYGYLPATPGVRRLRRAQERSGFAGSWSGGSPGYEVSSAALAGVLAVL